MRTIRNQTTCSSSWGGSEHRDRQFYLLQLSEKPTQINTKERNTKRSNTNWNKYPSIKAERKMRVLRDCKIIYVNNPPLVVNFILPLEDQFTQNYLHSRDNRIKIYFCLFNPLKILCVDERFLFAFRAVERKVFQYGIFPQSVTGFVAADRA